MASVLEALLILVGHPGGLALVQQQVTNQLASLAVFDVNAPAVAVAYAARYNPGVVLCCRVPADERLNPTVNVTAAQQALLGPPLAQAFANLAARGGVWAVKANGNRNIGVHILFAVDRLINMGAAGMAEIARLINTNERDASHLYQPSDFAGVPAGPLWLPVRWRRLECCIEAHEDNMMRIACRVFSVRFGAGCICAAGANANPFKPPCKGAPGVARAVVNGMQV